MNALDRLIAYISPVTGLKRAAARSNIKNLYEAARPSRGFAGWWTTDASADTELSTQVQTLRNRARDLGRNNPWVCRAYDLLAAKMVGTGIRPRLADAIPDQVRQRTMDLWKVFVDECDAEGLRDLYALQHLVARTVVESGEALIRFIPSPGKRVPWQMRVLEPDWIDASQHRSLPEGGRVVLGVEYNTSGRRVAYWMFTNHPGADVMLTRGMGPDVERVPAEFIAPVFYAMRPEQTRGVPWCVPSVTYAKNLDDLYYARQERAKAQACFTAFIRRTSDTEITTDYEKQRKLRELSPGMIEYLSPDEDVTFGNPPSGGGDNEWEIMLLHAIAAGIGVTYAQLTGDMRQVNYSSVRAGILDFWSLLDNWQQLMLKPMMLEPIWRKFDMSAQMNQMRGYLLDPEWVMPDRAFIDPLKDGQAIDAALLSGRSTFHEVISAYGKDPEAHIEELKREREELGDLNLPFIAQRLGAKASPSPIQQAAEKAVQQEDQQQQQPSRKVGAGNGEFVIQ